ncbi:MAG: hypothetical protein QM757_21490 [Paludibaculum sp.]
MAARGRISADDALAAALAAGQTVIAAASTAGVSERTAFRRLDDPAFRARVAELRAGMVSTAAGRLADGMGQAADVLRALLAHKDPHVRHRAAAKLLEVGLKVVELAELEQRVAELERATEPGGESPRTRGERYESPRTDRTAGRPGWPCRPEDCPGQREMVFLDEHEPAPELLPCPRCGSTHVVLIREVVVTTSTAPRSEP